VKIDSKKSADVIDRRRIAGVAFLTGMLALVATWFGLARPAAKDPELELVQLVSTALDRGQAYWGDRITGYRHAKVVLFRGSTPTPCGRGLAASGPFYCPTDERVYMDMAFIGSIDNRLAQAYVIAHELGHHVQKMRGELEGRPSVDVELGADCYAGRWIAFEQHAGRLDVGDVTAALAEASSIGDDKICASCSPETWSHGSSSQRVAAVNGGIDQQSCARY
jgi:predicted metalloprotease